MNQTRLIVVFLLAIMQCEVYAWAYEGAWRTASSLELP